MCGVHLLLAAEVRAPCAASSRAAAVVTSRLPTKRCCGGTWTIERQLQQRRRIGQVGAPVIELLPARWHLAATPLPLGKVGILHGQARAAAKLHRHKGGVERAEFLHQQHVRPVIADDVVHGQQEHMVSAANCSSPCEPQQGWSVGKVKRAISLISAIIRLTKRLVQRLFDPLQIEQQSTSGSWLRQSAARVGHRPAGRWCATPHGGARSRQSWRARQQDSTAPSSRSASGMLKKPLVGFNCCISHSRCWAKESGSSPVRSWHNRRAAGG